MNAVVQEKVNPTEVRIKHMLSLAAERPKGLLLAVKQVGIREFDTPQSAIIKNGIGTVKVTDTLVGFVVEEHGSHKTYRTYDMESRAAFLAWIEKAIAFAPLSIDYGDGPGKVVKFQRSV